VLAALDTAMAEGGRAAADRKAGQGSLFGAAPEPSVARGDGIDDARAWSKADTLRAEHEVLGFYLSGHPLEERAGLFALLSSVKSNEVVERPIGSEIVLAGLVVGLSEAVVKTGNSAGRKMARFRLEDLVGSVAVTCFPRAYEACRQHIVDNAVIVVRAKIEERGEEPGLVLEEAMDVEAALARFSGGVVIQLCPEDDACLPELHTTLVQHRGKSPLFFLVTGRDGCTRTVRASGSHGVAISAGLAADVDRLLGRGRVRLARL